MTAIPGIVLAPEKVAALTEHAKHGTEVIERVKSLTDDMLTPALSYCQAKLTQLEETRLEIAEPLNKAKSALDKHFRELRGPFEQAKELLKSRLESLEIERRRLAALAQGRAVLVAQNAVEEGDPVFLPVAVPAKIEGASFRYEWDWELEDISKVPVSFLAVNAHSVKMHLSQFKNSEVAAPVPGLKFTKVPKAIAR